VKRNCEQESQISFYTYWKRKHCLQHKLTCFILLRFSLCLSVCRERVIKQVLIILQTCCVTYIFQAAVLFSMSFQSHSDLLCDLYLSSSCLIFNVLSESLRLGGFEMFPSKKKPKVKPVKQTVSVITSIQGC